MADDENNVVSVEHTKIRKKTRSKKKKPPTVEDGGIQTEHKSDDTTVTFDLSAKDVNIMAKICNKKTAGAKWLKLKEAKSNSPTMKRMRYDPYPGKAPVAKEAVQKYMRGEKMNMDGIKTGFYKHQFKRKERQVKKTANQAARAELLLLEETGFIESEDVAKTCRLSQHDIVANVDITSAQKFFQLNLDKFGPYRCNYTRNGRQLLIGGGKGHVAAMDWQTKKLMCELNVMESINDVKWLHIETMFAVAQRQWTYIYDNQGIELHCLKTLDQTLRLEFLPYHFLLAASNARGYLSYIDVSIGQKVTAFQTGLGRLDVMCQNPRNAIVHLGHSGGTVTLWSPNVKQPLVKMLCHGSGTRSIAVNQTGDYMATSGIDRTLKIWDLRTYKVLQSYKVGAGASHLAFSQQDNIAAGIGNIVEIYKDCVTSTTKSVYLNHRCPGSIANLQFVPYEDVLGVGHTKGFSSLLVPGSGEPNFDALEANPYQTKKQRQQAEVKMLLEKVQPEMISLDTSALGKVDVKTLQEQMEDKKKILWLKPQDIDFDPKYKKKGRSKAGKIEKRKQGVKFEHKRQQIKELAQKAQSDSQQAKQAAGKPYNVFDRFKESASA